MGWWIATKIDTTQCPIWPNMLYTFNSINLPLRPWEFAKKATARRTHTYTHTNRLFKITFLDVLLIVHPKSGLIENSISLYDANTSMGHGSKTNESCRSSPSEQIAGIVRAEETIVLSCRQKSPPTSLNHHLSFAPVRCLFGCTFGPNFLQNNGFGKVRERGPHARRLHDFVRRSYDSAPGFQKKERKKRM